MSVRAMRAHSLVLFAKVRADADSNGFLPDTQMDWATHLLLGITLGDAPLDDAHAQHFREQAKQIFVR